MKTNHRRGFKAGTHRRKGCTFFQKTSALADVHIEAMSNYGSSSNRVMARSVAAAKKFVSSRFRFHEKAAIRRILAGEDPDC